MEYVTRDGLVVVVGRVNRRLLDRIDIPTPAPPTKKVETWGGVVEEVPVLNDAQYQCDLLEYKLQLWREQLDILATAITPPDDAKARAQWAALFEVIGGDVDYKTGFLRYCLDDTDRAAIVTEILYQSTVTQRGIDEAVKRFDYKWRGKPLLEWGVKTSYGERGELAVEWRAALKSGIPWEAFADLPGPDQSAHVAFWMLEDRLAGLLSQ